MERLKRCFETLDVPSRYVSLLAISDEENKTVVAK
jgi:hypothetical protein